MSIQDNKIPPPEREGVIFKSSSVKRIMNSKVQRSNFSSMSFWPFRNSFPVFIHVIHNKSLIGCPSWIRTTIAGVRGQSPAVRRKGNNSAAETSSRYTVEAVANLLAFPTRWCFVTNVSAINWSLMVESNYRNWLHKPAFYH